MNQFYFRLAGLLTLLCLFTSATYAQSTISGTVLDEDGFPLPGVNVLVVGTSSGTVTDLDGIYSVTAAEDGILRFSYVGFAAQEIAVAGQSTIDVTLSTNSTLDEVVVIGYGASETRESVTGAVSAVSSEEISEVVTNNIGQAIQGRLAGVQVTADNGAPGEGPIIRVRGIGSINFGSGPLYVIDGVPTGGLNSFDTRDIDNVTVLKDASATAIYGSRAANGVILISTKQGRVTDGVEVDLHTTVGFSNVAKRLDLLDREGFLEYADRLGATITRDLSTEIDGVPLNQTDTDWQDAVFRTGLQTQNTIGIRGGNETSRFFGSLGYYKQEGTMIGTDYERYNFRINSDHNLTDRLIFGENLVVVQDQRSLESFGGGRTQLQHTGRMIPYLPVFDPGLLGGYSAPISGLDGGADPENPVRVAELLTNENRVLRLFGNIFFDYEILEGLNARVTYGANYTNFRGNQRTPIYETNAGSPTVANSISENTSVGYSPLYNAQLSYDRIIGDHGINVTAVVEQQEFISRFLNASGDQATNNLTNLQGSANQVVSGGNNIERIQSLVGRARYGYRGKYLISVSFRRDGSSLWAPGNNIENFPAGAIAWRISEEPFMQGTPISDLKLRASYGRVGFAGVNPYGFQAPIIQSQGAAFGGGAQPIAAYTNTLANTQLSWELTDMFNIGVDLGFLNNRLNFSFEYYDRQTDNLILDVPLEASSGLNSTRQNIGAMSNTGIEFQGSYNSTAQGDFTWEVTANLSANTNEILQLGPDNAPIFSGNQPGSDFTGGFPITRTGADEISNEIQAFYGFQVDRIYRSQDEIDNDNAMAGDGNFYQEELTAPGDFRYVDTDGDGRITEADRVQIGSYLPDFIFGTRFAGNYRNLDFSLFVQGSVGNDIYNAYRAMLTSSDRLFNSLSSQLDAWTPENPNSDIPRTVRPDPNNNNRVSDYFLEDGSYARLKNLTVGYRVPLTNSNTFSSIRFYLTGQNLVTLTDYSGYDPEIGSRYNQLANGIDYGQYPVSRSFLFGLQVGF